MTESNVIADLRAALDETESENDALVARLAEIEFAACGGELIPLSVIERLSEGDAPARIWREYRGLSLRALAEQAGISPSMLSEVETGKKEGSVRTLAALSRVLHVDVDDLLPW